MTEHIYLKDSDLEAETKTKKNQPNHFGIFSFWHKKKPTSSKIDSGSSSFASIPRNPAEKSTSKSQLKTKNQLPKFKAEDMLIAWQASRAENSLRHPYREPIIFLLLISSLAYGLFFNNYLLSIIAILLGILLYLSEKTLNEASDFGINGEGIFIQNQLYPFEQLEDFWIFYQPGGRKELSLRTHRTFEPFVRLPLGKADPAEIRQLLLDFLPEVEQTETALDNLERYL